MIKKIFSALLLLFICNTANAQKDVSKDIDWLRTNSNRIDHVNCPSKNFFGEVYEVNNKGLNLYTNEGDEKCTIKFEDITDIELYGDYLYVFSNEYVGNKALVLKIHTSNPADMVYAKHHLIKVAKERSHYFNK